MHIERDPATGQNSIVVEYRIVVEGKSGKEIAGDLLANDELTNIRNQLGEEYVNGVSLYLRTTIEGIAPNYNIANPFLKTFASYQIINRLVTASGVMFIRLAKKESSNNDVLASASVLGQANSMFRE